MCLRNGVNDSQKHIEMSGNNLSCLDVDQSLATSWDLETSFTSDSQVKVRTWKTGQLLHSKSGDGVLTLAAQ